MSSPQQNWMKTNEIYIVAEAFDTSADDSQFIFVF